MTVKKTFQITDAVTSSQVCGQPETTWICLKCSSYVSELLSPKLSVNSFIINHFSTTSMLDANVTLKLYPLLTQYPRAYLGACGCMVTPSLTVPHICSELWTHLLVCCWESAYTASSMSPPAYHHKLWSEALWFQSPRNEWTPLLFALLLSVCWIQQQGKRRDEWQQCSPMDFGATWKQWLLPELMPFRWWVHRAHCTCGALAGVYAVQAEKSELTAQCPFAPLPDRWWQHQKFSCPVPRWKTSRSILHKNTKTAIYFIKL